METQYRFNGKMGLGAMKTLREKKREEAEERNTRTAPERRRHVREGWPYTRPDADQYTGR